MSRYIDANALKKRVSELIVPEWTRTLIGSWVDAEPTVDAVPVVRCHECQWYDANGDYYDAYCDKNNICVEDDFYCADGERR